MLGAVEEFPATLMRSAWVSAVSSFGVCAVRCLSHAFFRNNDESGDLCSDLGPAAFRDSPSEFRSTPPRRGDNTAGSASSEVESFDPRPREGATRHSPRAAGESTRFDPRPREGATSSVPAIACDVEVSIHAPVKGATRLRRHPLHPARSFDPRSREGSDASIGGVGAALDCFDPRSREGSDAAWRARCAADAEFRSTLP